MPLRFAWEKPPSTLLHLLHIVLLVYTGAIRLTPLHCMPLVPFPARHARHSDIARLLSKSGTFARPPHRLLANACVAGPALLAGASHRKWNSKCFSEYLN